MLVFFLTRLSGVPSSQVLSVVGYRIFFTYPYILLLLLGWRLVWLWWYHYVVSYHLMCYAWLLIFVLYKLQRQRQYSNIFSFSVIGASPFRFLIYFENIFLESKCETVFQGIRYSTLLLRTTLKHNLAMFQFISILLISNRTCEIFSNKTFITQFSLWNNIMEPRTTQRTTIQSLMKFLNPNATSFDWISCCVYPQNWSNYMFRLLSIEHVNTRRLLPLILIWFPQKAQKCHVLWCRNRFFFFAHELVFDNRTMNTK